MPMVSWNSPRSACPEWRRLVSLCAVGAVGWQPLSAFEWLRDERGKLGGTARFFEIPSLCVGGIFWLLGRFFDGGG